ncbi:MAG: DEAD/DEAH box helicase domain protein [Candidatus Falkowbacteria bacterium GW2011_GWC2_38_22]|uniref:DEAD/DEAH box helicase domain protein n=1 Tax=Candidatus Falkowbacteria bacterium GW2011_GWE1_38_31 TaxID=1618638 RepID=A0A0G0K5M4_9BACT|nr:MAG: DEAD/DEAH box helicase domain protein [Candidatus Falkowbacteria bacterium GW2011_GWF2_38_1205]KKQ61948.1 MAG: DEAD/DEAH box helicase domain protein [Candidatus Falkowbacteria bacterium GW2011_GWC2_38_22]KKQ63890.1 MAG: DEAD/DEAH box helicase domain protein [Candidatus Falkowbacteria bacterium GW2011_GWF1_38_22]KKQ66147.1 MAG: DEAD/DEAH box helicase domain protein [Candidatus Falkowbacteria bacterium GW2011_GWE2_38_254]KKQ70750.1 MAG: DEAD/DEAH box helicase domain protein [Candidatus Fa
MRKSCKIKYMTTFKELGLHPDVMKGLDDLGFVEPSPIQEQAIPFLLKSKKDLTALAQTGTGKTAAFALPILNQIKADGKELQAFIICPTRELCLQISQDIKKFAKYCKGVTVTAVYGGERIEFQIKSLRSGANIVVGTPGRVHDLIRRKILKLQNIKWLVLDEADEMLDMGFKDDLDAILSETPETRQTMLFSATMSKSVHAIARQYMKDAEEISIGTKNVGAENVSHEHYIVQGRDRFEALKRILDNLPGVYGILFCRTRNETQEVADKLKQANYDAEAMHGDISQGMRTKIMDRFKRKQIRLLVATDVAARGIDVNDLTHVINYNFPDQNESYTHRSGRTGRAQKSGVSIIIATPRETRRIREIENIIGKKIEYKKVPNGEDICRKQIDNFLEEVKNTKIKDTISEEYFSEISEKLKSIKKDELVKYILASKFGHLFGDKKNKYNLNADAQSFREKRIGGVSGGDTVNLKFSIGKRHGLDVKGVFGLINSKKSLLGIEVGKINIAPEYTIVSVEERRAGDVLKHLNGTNFRGKKLNITITNESAGFSRGGGERNKGYKGKKEGFRKKRY